MGCVSKGKVVPAEGVPVPGYEVSDLLGGLFPVLEVSEWSGVLPVHTSWVSGGLCPGGYVSELCKDLCPRV